MNIVISLDYEVYFGRHSGGARQTVVEPTLALCETVRRFGVPMVFYVDVMWLLRLREEAQTHNSLMAEHDLVMRQLDTLVRAGCELQLHVHPHWVDASWGGDGWDLNLHRYRLHDFDDAAIADMVSRGAEALRAFGGTTPVCAFRAGGWCLQPFGRLRAALLNAGICIDSTVYAGGRQQGLAQNYDFSEAPGASRWFFEHDPLQPEPDGSFLEVPIASHRVGPLFYWRLGLTRKLGLPEHRPLGEGQALMLSRSDLVRRLSWPSTSVVSIDGLKAGFLEAAYSQYERRQMEDFVLIGHPKALTRYSLDRLGDFLHRHRRDTYSGMGHYLGEFSVRRRPQPLPYLQVQQALAA